MEITGKSKRIFDILIGYAWIIQVVTLVISGNLKMLGVQTSAITFVLMLPLLFLILMYYIKNFQIHIISIFVVAFLVLAYMVAYIFFSLDGDYIDSTIQSVCLSGIFYIIAFIAARQSNFRQIIWIASFIGVFLMVASYFTSLRRTLKDMTYAYYLLAQVIPQIDAFACKKKTVHLISSIVGVVMLFNMGTRGPLIFVILFIVFKHLTAKKHRVWNVILCLLCSGLLIFLIKSDTYIVLLKEVSEWLEDRGINNYMINALISGNMESIEQRGKIIGSLWHFLWEKPLTGYGMFGDRILVNTYAHNIVFEILIHYGIVIGTFILYGLSYLVFKTLLSEKNDDKKACLYIFIFAFLLKFFVSSSYLTDYSFWFAFGYFLKSYLNLKTKKN